MIISFLREHKYASYLYLVIRLFLGWSWMTAGYHKISDGFDASGYLKGSIANPVKGPEGDTLYGWWVSFLENFALPNVDVFNWLVPWGEFLVGLGLLLGCLTTTAMFFGILMNYSFFLSGTVSHNPTDLFLGALILIGGFNAGKIGLDHWVIPWIRTKCKKVCNQNPTPPVVPPTE